MYSGGAEFEFREKLLATQKLAILSDIIGNLESLSDSHIEFSINKNRVKIRFYNSSLQEEFNLLMVKYMKSKTILIISPKGFYEKFLFYPEYNNC